MTEWTEGAADAIGSVLRIELVATEHGFNDMTPGPTIEVNAGETLIVRFVNQRSRPSCFCLAGLRCTGTPAGETGEYSFVLSEPGEFRYCICDDASCLYGVLRVL